MLACVSPDQLVFLLDHIFLAPGLFDHVTQIVDDAEGRSFVAPPDQLSLRSKSASRKPEEDAPARRRNLPISPACWRRSKAATSPAQRSMSTVGVPPWCDDPPDIPDFRANHFQSAGVTRYDALSWPEEGNGAARVHHNSRRCRGVAAHGMRTAAAASCERIDGNSRR